MIGRIGRGAAFGGLAVTLSCASAGPPAGGPAVDPAGPVAASAPAARTPAAPQSWRVGAWELDLLALDREPRGTTFRLLDLGILTLLEVGRGQDYGSFAFLETPGVIEPFTLRWEGEREELRLLDVQALALLRRTKERPGRSELQLLKLPVLRALYGHVEEPGLERTDLLFLFRQERGD